MYPPLVFTRSHRGHACSALGRNRVGTPGGDDVVDPEDHVGDLGSGVDCLGLHPEGLKDVGGLGVLSLSGVEVDTHVLSVLAGVGVLEFDDDVDGVETCVLGEGPGDALHSLGELLDGELFPSADGCSELAEPESELDLGCSCSCDDLSVLEGDSDGADGIVDGPLDLFDDGLAVVEDPALTPDSVGLWYDVDKIDKSAPAFLIALSGRAEKIAVSQRSLKFVSRSPSEMTVAARIRTKRPPKSVKIAARGGVKELPFDYEPDSETSYFTYPSDGEPVRVSVTF